MSLCEPDFPPLLPELIARQVTAAPDAVAVSDTTRSWTYRELSGHADALAAALPASLGPGDRIGVHIGRRVALAAALVAVLRSGAAYVPLDPDYPKDRLRYIAEDAALTAIVSDDPAAAATLCPRVVPAAAAEATGAARQPRPPARPVRAEDPAYVIYTSGSTGAPKGTVVPHRGVANILRYAAGEFGFTARDSVLATASVAFDFSVLEMLLPLTTGGRLHLAERSVARDPAALTAELERQDIGFLMGTPSMFGAMLGAGWKPRPGLTLVAGGEALPPATARSLTADCTLWNIYGPTETSIFVACERVDPRDVTIGRPVAGVTLTVLDDGVPVAAGEPGELCVSGVNVGLGYLGRPDLTAQRFRPLDGDPGTPCYRTGDLARVRPDGRIEYLGRLDDQVKVRGFRLELGGIEAALLEEPDVREAAVVLTAGAAEPLLAAHVVFSDGTGDPQDLRRRLKDRLPGHEVPHHVFVADTLPRTPNGKLDRTALRLLPVPHVHDSTPAAPAATTADTTEQLLGIFREVLDRADVTPSDNFFDIGGDSLSALRVISRATAAGLRLGVGDLYAGPDVVRLAARISDAPPEPLAEPAQSAGTVRVLPSQGWFFGLGLPDPAHFTEPVALAARRRIDHDRLQRALDALADRHPALTSRFDGDLVRQDSAQLPLLRFDFGADDQRFPGTVNDLYTHFDLAKGPVCIAASFRGAHADVLLLVFHHLAVDGLSVQILTQDLDALYAERLDARKDAPLSAFGHSALLTEFAGSPQAVRAEKEWLALPWHEVGALPAEPIARKLTQRDMESFSVTLEPRTAYSLLSVSQHSPASTEEVILAGVAEGAAVLGEGPTVSVDVFRHGRWQYGPGHDVSGTVGWLAGVVPHVMTAAPGAAPLGRFSALRAQIRHLRSLEAAWGPLRHSSAARGTRDRLAALPRPQLYLHYRGRGLTALPPLDAFTPTSTYLGDPKTPLAPPFRPVEIRFAADDGVVTSNWRYSPRVFAPTVIEGLAAAAIGSITAFAAALTGGSAQGRP